MALSDILVRVTLKVFLLTSLAFDTFPVLLQESYVSSAVNFSVIQFTVLHMFRVALDFYL